MRPQYTEVCKALSSLVPMRYATVLLLGMPGAGLKSPGSGTHLFPMGLTLGPVPVWMCLEGDVVLILDET